MSKIWKIFQYGYLLIAIICIIEGIIRFNTNRNSSYLFFGFAVFVTIMFFVKRRFRIKVEERNRNAKNNS